MKIDLEDLKHFAKEHDQTVDSLPSKSYGGLAAISEIAFLFAYLNSKDSDFWSEWEKNKKFICETISAFSKGEINYNI